MSPGEQRINALAAELGFHPVEKGTALGEFHDFPATLTMLGDEPPAVMFGIRVNPEGTDTQPVLDLMSDVPEDEASLSIDDGIVWLSIYDIGEASNEQIIETLDAAAAVIAGSDLALSPGCLNCGDGTAEAAYVQSRPTRLCAACRSGQRAILPVVATAAASDPEPAEPSVAATMRLPAMCAVSALGWGVFWVLFEWAIDWMRIRQVDINAVTMLVFIAFFGGVGGALGYPLRRTLATSIGLRKSPKIKSTFVVLATVLAGEVLVVAFSLFWWIGVFDLELAAGLLADLLQTYTPVWIMFKVMCAGGLWATAFTAIAPRPESSVQPAI